MAKVPSRRLVIDACVVRAAGGVEAVHPTSKQCRDFLTAVKRICHRLVLTPAIDAEWNKSRPGAAHARYLSTFARGWLVEMYARKKVERIDVVLNDSLRSRMAKAVENPKIAAILDKDCHLIEAALATDKIVVSSDNKCRDHFRGIAHLIAELQDIGWVNPADPTETVIEWLEAGARIKRSQWLAGTSPEK